MAEESKTEETEESGETAAEQTQPTDPNRDSVVTALRRERVGYVARGLDDRVAGVDTELQRLGAGAEEKTSAAPRETAVESRPRRTAGRGGKQGE